MRIGVFSDIHDHLSNLEKALAFFTNEKIETLIFCGDFCSPIPSRVMGGFKGVIHCVFGNGDGDRFTIAKFANSEFQNLKLHGEHAELEIGGAKIAVTHYPLYGKALAKTGDYDAVFSGHTHQVSKELIGKCLWLNPGDVMGWKGKATIAVYDTDSNEAIIYELK